MSDDVRGGSATASEQARALLHEWLDELGWENIDHEERLVFLIQQALDAERIRGRLAGIAEARAEGAKALEEEAQIWFGAVERVRAEERQRAARIVREAGESDTFAAIESESAEEIARAIEADP